jgi:hypothetical protein
MKCVWTQKVSLLIDGELVREEAREVERHLEACGDCREAREDFLLLRRQIASYRLDLDAFAERRALKRILADSGNNAAKAEHETVAATPRLRERFVSVFGMPRLSPVGLAALLLLLFGVAVGVVSLLNSRRPSTEIAKTNQTPAPSVNANKNDSTVNTQITTPTVPNDSTADGNKQSDGASVAKNSSKQAGTELANGTKTSATNIHTRERAPRIESAGHKVPKPSVRFNGTRVDAPVAESARNDVEAVVDNGGAVEVSDKAAARRNAEVTAGESDAARHVEQAQLLLRSFRNARPAEVGRRASSDLAYDKERSKKLLYQNIVLRREAASRGNLPVESLLDSLEPILIDIANLPDRPAPADVRAINERMRRKNLVAMLQISAVESASARTY